MSIDPVTGEPLPERRCHHAGCIETQSECVECLEPGGDEVSWYCPHHAELNGFCWMCGYFCAGQDGFDNLHPGLCETCHDEVRLDADDDDYDYPDDDPYGDEADWLREEDLL